YFVRRDDAVPVHIGEAPYGGRPVSPDGISEHRALLPKTDWRPVDLDQAVLIPPQRESDVPTSAWSGQHLSGEGRLNPAIADRAAVVVDLVGEGRGRHAKDVRAHRVVRHLGAHSASQQSRVHTQLG